MMRTLALAFVLLAPAVALADIIPTLPSTLAIEVAPSAPTPGERVTLSTQSFSGNQAEIVYTWRVNGAVVDQGVGVTSITITAGAVGSATEVTISANENGVPRGSASVTLRPARVDLVWEGHTSVPPLLGILPLTTGESPVTILAVPTLYAQGAAVAANNLMYVWRINNNQAPIKSGVGVSSIVVTPPSFASAFGVSVTASTRDGGTVASNRIVIEPTQSHILVYENAPLLGIRLDRAITGQFPLLGDEATFSMYPVYVERAGNLGYRWTVNGAEATSTSPREITFRKTGAGQGHYTIGASYTSASKLFERATSSFLLTF